jgi:hypothetical protein
MAEITNVINVALLPEGKAAAATNMNVVAIITKEQGVLSTAERYRAYKSAAAVAGDFGASSEVTAYANTVFATSPNAINFGGALVVGYWRGESEKVAATPGVLTGAEIDPDAALAALRQIDKGSMNITIIDKLYTLINLDFTGCRDFSACLAKLKFDDDGNEASVRLENNRVVITTQATGDGSDVGFALEGAEGDFIGSILGLTDGGGASTVGGADPVTLSAETKLAGITAISAQVQIRGAMFIDEIVDSDIEDLATWSKANQVLIYEVFSGRKYFALNTSTNPVWANTLSGLDTFRCLYSKAGNRKLAASYMARAHTVNFNAENSAMTMHLKELAVPAEDYSQTEIDYAKIVGLDLFTTIKNSPVVLTSPANDFVDNVYNLIAFVDSVQVDMFNLLKMTGTKIPQTTPGVLTMIDQGEKTTRRFVRAGVFGPGEWSKPDYFGDYKTFFDNIREYGFYWQAGSLADQSTADRQSRKSPVLQCAVKNQGAIHSADVVINFNL